MDLFAELFRQTLPLYVLIAIGFVAGRYGGVSREAVARLLIYVVAPGVVFFGALRAPLTPAVFSLPFLTYAVCVSIALLTRWYSRWTVRSASERSILAFASGSGNTGYFGLPVALFLFGEQAIPIQIVANQGFLVFENTVGFYLTARSRFTARESLTKMARLPSIYAFSAGLLCQLLGITIEAPMDMLNPSFKGAFTVLGMMMLGLGFAQIPRPTLDLRFTLTAFFSKFALWPLLMGGVLLLNREYLQFYDGLTTRILWLLAIVPLPANSVAYAAELKTHPEKVGIAVFLSTLFALLSMPLMLSWGGF
jgi:hypothetical protein